ncbi:MAG TPA: phenylacetic acid degradation protein [Sphingomonas bacterium]|jgi:acyl-coenzyme A thioesterase PaaI-like protein|uniref:Phenylacetic acid degradation protein n=1 Tax=Sphingomonas bacterium TaxID=1895847 RepID=A0A3D0WGJ9_9SPHN|nr:phenylacetic acid degradation protein [Sphingomonas bacterium]
MPDQIGAAADDAPPPFRFFPDPDLPGWHRWELTDPTRYNAFLAPLSVRVEGEGRARVRMVPQRIHSNIRDHVHGGALLGFADVAIFAAARALRIMNEGGASTVDLSAQFIDGAVAADPIEAEVELLRETGRLFFVRGLIVQDDRPCVSFNATARK